MTRLQKFHDLAIQLMVKIRNDSLSDECRIQRERQERLEKVLIALLQFKSDEETEKWLLKPNKQCDNLPPIDLVNSEYGTRHLLKVINFVKRNGEIHC